MELYKKRYPNKVYDREEKDFIQITKTNWNCHICKEIRPDSKISVLTKPLIVNGMEIGKQNIRYCNDKNECIKQAKTFSFIKEK